MVVAHPAAQVLGLPFAEGGTVGKISARWPQPSFEPASEHGRRGMDELHEQTVNLLSFHDMPKQVYGAQVAFNLLSRYGEQSSPPLDVIERRVLEHYRLITGNNRRLPSLMLVQAPVFHGHAFSLFLELEKTVAVGDLDGGAGGEHVHGGQSRRRRPAT